MPYSAVEEVSELIAQQNTKLVKAFLENYIFEGLLVTFSVIMEDYHCHLTLIIQKPCNREKYNFLSSFFIFSLR